MCWQVEFKHFNIQIVMVDNYYTIGVIPLAIIKDYICLIIIISKFELWDEYYSEYIEVLF